MSEEKTPAEIAQDALNKVASQMVGEMQMRHNAVHFAVELVKKDEALFAGGMLEYADRIYKFIKTGEVNKTPLKD